MRNYSRLLAWGTVCLAVLLAVVWVAPLPLLHGQDKTKSKKSSRPGRTRPQGNTKALDIQADQMQATFTKEAEELAGKYFDAGYPEKARALLESVLAVNPEAPNIQQKLEQVKEGILNSNEYDVEVNASQGWKPSGVIVTEKRPFRVKAEGTYRFDAGASGVTAAGFPDKDPAEDMIAAAPCGALVGVIVGDGKSGKPFAIGELLDNYSPKESGMLLLRINAPPGNKNSGKIKVSISGSVQVSK